MTYSIISDNSTVYKKYYIIVSFWGKTHLRGFYFYLLKPDKVQFTSSTSRYYLNFQDYSMVKKINMSYGATVGASAANSNLIEFKK